jgi:hemolysin activation/secretion protein
MFQLGHTLRAGYLVAPEHPSESQVISGSYTAPILGSAWTLLAYGYKSNSNVAALGGTNVLGNGYQIGGRAIVRLPGTRLLQTVNFGLDYKDFKENIVIPNADPTLPAGVIETPIAYVPLTVAYSVQRATDTTVINGSVTLTAGVRGLGASEASNAVKRYNSVGNFVRINLTGDLTYAFKHDIVGYLSYSGQYADTPLVANEQFAIGGATSVRGYFLSEAVGDNGSNLIAELRSPQLAPDSWRFVQDWRAYVFVDSGFVHVRSPLPDQIVNYRLVGTGVGTRFQLFTDISGNFAVGVALTDGPTTKAGDGRAIFSVTGAF